METLKNEARFSVDMSAREFMYYCSSREEDVLRDIEGDAKVLVRTIRDGDSDEKDSVYVVVERMKDRAKEFRIWHDQYNEAKDTYNAELKARRSEKEEVKE